MLINNIVQADLVTVGPRATLAQVLRVLNHKGVRHVPVLEDGQLVGIISESDLVNALLKDPENLERPIAGLDSRTPRDLTTPRA